MTRTTALFLGTILIGFTAVTPGVNAQGGRGGAWTTLFDGTASKAGTSLATPTGPSPTA